METTIKKEKAFSELTKSERRMVRLEQHYASLQRLYDLCGGGKHTGKKLSSTLLRLEQQAHNITTMQCNGEGNRFLQDKELNAIQNKVQDLFNGKLSGLFVNGDARGYALKINEKVMLSDYKETGLHKDWGGYGILAPTINGEY